MGSEGFCSMGSSCNEPNPLNENLLNLLHTRNLWNL